jgi:hypothetical protein
VGHRSAGHIQKDVIRHAHRDSPPLKWFIESRELVAQAIAEDLDALFREDEAKMFQVPTSDNSMNELLCALDHENLERYCTKFLLAMLAS